MKILGRLSLGATALVALLGAAAGPAYAHEKWFVGGPVGGLRWDSPVPAAALGAHRGGAGGDAFGRDAVEGTGAGLFARAGGLRGHRGTPQPALRAGAPDPRHPRRRAPARERRAGDALLPGQRDAWCVG